jgi:predicted Zn-dependent protease
MLLKGLIDLDGKCLGNGYNEPYLNRRNFLQYTTSVVAGVGLTSCATNPVTGESQVMLMSEQEEVNLDQKNSPHQFSADYGEADDPELNWYIGQVGKKIASVSHRPKMPYSFRCVNATYVNAYAFPGGSIATTRGIMLNLDNEAELAGLLGHEVGHVNARHTASRMSKSVLAQLAIVSISTYVGTQDSNVASIATGLGGLGAGLLLAKYSRDDERQADKLGMDYMVKAGHTPQGMVGLMEELQKLLKHQPSSIKTMFATHPMSLERYNTANKRVIDKYAKFKAFPNNRERYKDYTANLRKIKIAIENMQAGEKQMMLKKFKVAEGHFLTALNKAPRDYAGLVMMAKCHFAQKNYIQAKRYAEEAKKVKPGEAQAVHLAGMAKINLRQFVSAFYDFDKYEEMLPGNPNTVFLKGISLEGQGKKQRSAQEYYRYLQIDRNSKQSQYAYNRLVSWGYIK